MIIEDLTRQYELQLREPFRGISVPPLWFARARATYGICLAADGTVKDIIPLRTAESGKTAHPPMIITAPLPYVRSSGSTSNFLCDTAARFFALAQPGKGERGRDAFDAAYTLHHAVLDDIDTPTAKAILAFFDRGPQPCVLSFVPADACADIERGCNLVFVGPDGSFAHEDAEIGLAWVRYRSTQGQLKGTCLATGRKDTPIADLHPRIKGLPGALMMGAALVSFNLDSCESYGLDGAAGAPVSDYAAVSYTTMLNSLLVSAANHITIGNTTLIFWADAADQAYAEVIRSYFDKTFESTAILTVPERCVLETPMHFLTLSSATPARAAVQFYLSLPFGEAVRNLEQHRRRLLIERPAYAPDYIYPRALLADATRAGSGVPASRSIICEMLYAIIANTPYPAELIMQILAWIDRDAEISHTKSAMLKAYLIKDASDTIGETLNPACIDISYVLGRLSAMLEFAERVSVDPNGEPTFARKYLVGMLHRPRHTMAEPIKLCHRHIDGMQAQGSRIYWSKQLVDIIGLLPDTCIPESLTPMQQCRFAVGYYQQRQYYYRPKK